MNYINGEIINIKLKIFTQINRSLMPFSLLSTIINCMVIKLLILLMVVHLKWSNSPFTLLVQADWDSWWTYEGISGMHNILITYLL